MAGYVLLKFLKMSLVDGRSQNSTKDLLVDLLKPLLAEAVAEAVASIELPSAPDHDLLNVDQAAEFLSVSKDYVYRRTATNEIPNFRKGKRLYFSRKALTQWLQEGRG